MPVYIFMTEHNSSGIYFHYHNYGSEKEKVISISYEIFNDLLDVNYRRIFELFVSLKNTFGEISDDMIIKAICSVDLSKTLSFDSIEEECISFLKQLK